MKIEGVKKLDGTALDLEELVKLAGRTGGEIEYVTDRRFIGSKALKIAPDAVYIGNGELLELLQQLKGIKGFPIQHLNEVNKDLQTSVYRQRFLEDTPEFKFKEKNLDCYRPGFFPPAHCFQLLFLWLLYLGLGDASFVAGDFTGLSWTHRFFGEQFRPV